MIQPSLIQKKVTKRPITSQVGLFFRVAVIFFVATVILSAALYFYKSISAQQLDDQRQVLRRLEVEFEPSLIAELEAVSVAIKSARQLINEHQQPTSIFKLLEEETLVDVHFTTFSYSASERSITLSGIAPNYTTIAAQSSVFESLNSIEAATFSNLGLGSTGSVTFTIRLQFNEELIRQ